MVNYKRNTFVDGELAKSINFKESNSDLEALEYIINDLMYADFNYFIEIDEDEYFERTGLRMEKRTL